VAWTQAASSDDMAEELYRKIVMRSFENLEVHILLIKRQGRLIACPDVLQLNGLCYLPLPCALAPNFRLVIKPIAMRPLPNKAKVPGSGATEKLV